MNLKINTEELIKAYNEGQSMNSIAKAFGTYPTTVKRILERNGVELRHDAPKKGAMIVKDGEKLIKWAKAQGRLVTKTELANAIGKKKLSPSYFVKYPELGKYMVAYEQNDLQEYSQRLYDWLQRNDIEYKPKDRTRLKLAVTALLLGEYSNIIIQLNIKPKCISKKQHEHRMTETLIRAIDAHTTPIFINEEYFLDDLKLLERDLKDLKHVKI